MKMAAVVLAVALAVGAAGCQNTKPEQWPVKKMIDPVTEDVPNVRY